jgi:ABC-type transport system involved in cytochrome bd biosynthesis fused ATPase/permease subunit
VRDLSVDAIAEICSINDQDVFLFDASIQDNLTLYKKFPDDQLALAVRNAGLSTVIAEKGLDYSCGENGRNLSGGEKQRTAIARALLNDFPVLLFDEPTSALDHETSREIIRLITSLNGKTKIVVTHEADDEILSMFDNVYGIANGQLESDRTS